MTSNRFIADFSSGKIPNISLSDNSQILVYTIQKVEG